MDQRRLARPIGQRLGQAAVTGNAGDEGDAAARRQVAEDRRRQAHGAVEIDVHHLFGDGQVEVVGAHRDIITGQVDDQVDTAPGIYDEPAGYRQAGSVSGIARDQQGIAQTQGTQLFRITGRQRQRRATVGEIQRQRGADAARGADQPDALASPVGDDRIHGLTKLSVTSPRWKPHFDMKERLSMTLSSIRNIQSSKST